MINFRKVGKGKKTLVFLHGWGGSWQSWAPIIEKLTINNKQFTIYALDLPGFGLSTLSRPHDLMDYVVDIAEFFGKNKITNPVLIGHSFGGQVAAKFAIERGNLLSGLVLVDAAVARNNNFALRLNLFLVGTGKRLLWQPLFSRPFFSWIYPLIRGGYYFIRGWGDSDYFKLPVDSNIQKTARLVFRQNVLEDCSKIKIPTLIFWGEKDPPELTPLSMGKTLSEQIKGSKLVVALGAGHFSYLDEQELFCRELEKFI